MESTNDLEKELEEIAVDQELDYLASILTEAYIKKKMKENPDMKDPRQLMEIRRLIEESKKRSKFKKWIKRNLKEK